MIHRKVDAEVQPDRDGVRRLLHEKLVESATKGVIDFLWKNAGIRECSQQE